MAFVNVLGINYEIELVTTEELFERFKNDKEDIDEVKKIVGEKGDLFGGLCDPRKCKIYLNKTFRDDKLKKVLFHEIMEAAAVECQIDIDHVVLQALTNAIWCSDILQLDKLVKNELEEVNIPID